MSVNLVKQQKQQQIPPGAYSIFDSKGDICEDELATVQTLQLGVRRKHFCDWLPCLHEWGYLQSVLHAMLGCFLKLGANREKKSRHIIGVYNDFHFVWPLQFH